MKTEKVDVLVIGAGPSGTVAAAIIKKAGFTVKIVEKLQFPRFVIGESLLPRCMEALDEAGFLEAVGEKGFQQKFGAKFVKNGKICDYLFADQFTPGPRLDGVRIAEPMQFTVRRADCRRDPGSRIALARRGASAHHFVELGVEPDFERTAREGAAQAARHLDAVGKDHRARIG